MTKDENINDKVENILEENKVVEQSANNEKVELKEHKRIKQSKSIKKKQISLLVVCIILIIGTTAGLILLKINGIKKSSKEKNKVETLLSTSNKKQDPDTKFVLSNYTDTYNQNDVEIKYIYDNDGKIEGKENYDANKRLNYIEISGLKDERVQKKINDEIKSLAYSITKNKNNFSLDTTVCGNFSNILSVRLERSDYKKDKDGYDVINTSEVKCLNYNLKTGEKLEFEEIFTSSTPIASIIADAAYEVMAWDIDVKFGMGQEEWVKNANMDRRDTSEYEEELLAIVNEYNSKKGKIDYCISPTNVYIYNLGNFDKNNRTMTIKLVDYREYVAIYRRYSNGNIFKNDNVGVKNVIAFTEAISSYNIGMYGKLTDNCFVTFGDNHIDVYDMHENYDISEAVDKKIELHVKNKVQEELTKMKNKATSNSGKGYILEGYISWFCVSENEEYEPYIEIYIDYFTSEMSKEYFNNGLFKKMVELHNKPNVEIVDIFISRYDDEMSDIKSTENSYYLYYDINGNYLGDKETDLIKKQINTPIDSETETNNDQDNDNNNKEETPIVSPYQESVG